MEEKFKHHDLDENQKERVEALRQSANLFYEIIDSACPNSREKALAITNLEQTLQWANKSVALEGV